ncbi:MAG: hypothetical protein JST92_19805, partial [Deltaproteobacteria bacterium]|nr:hypothetical protein [Deltaproteobacteria bacterium]
MRPVHVALASSLAAALACSPSTTPSSFKTEGLAGTNQTVGGDLSFSLTALDDSGQQDTNYIGTV